MYQFVKFGLGGVAALALVITFAVGRSPSPPPAKAAEMETQFDEAWTDVMKVTALKKADMERRAAPVPVITERIAPDPPSVVLPPLVKLAEPVQRTATEHRRRHVREERNVCSRHNMRKVKVGRYKWRCRK